MHRKYLFIDSNSLNLSKFIILESKSEIFSVLTGTGEI